MSYLYTVDAERGVGYGISIEEHTAVHEPLPMIPPYAKGEW